MDDEIQDESIIKKRDNLGIADLGEISQGKYPKFDDMQVDGHIAKINEMERTFWRGKPKQK